MLKNATDSKSQARHETSFHERLKARIEELENLKVSYTKNKEHEGEWFCIERLSELSMILKDLNALIKEIEKLKSWRIDGRNKDKWIREKDVLSKLRGKQDYTPEDIQKIADKYFPDKKEKKV